MLERNAGTERQLVVSIEPGEGGVPELLRGQSCVRLVAPNREFLFCH